jgi:hypothetical protein
MICMKRKELSSKCSLKTEIGACAQDGTRFIRSASTTIRWGARRAQLSVARCWSRDPQQPIPRGGRAKRPAGAASPQEMLKMKQPPGMCMKTNDYMTICPTQKTTFLPVARHFTRNHTYFAETVGSFVIFERWRANSSLQNVENRGLPSRNAFEAQASCATGHGHG